MRSILTILACAASTAFATWTTIASNVGTAATGIAFASTTTGFLPADENGAGAEILKSTDGGVTWATNEPHQGGLLFLDVATDAAGQNIVVAGVLGEEFSIDGGNEFNNSIGGGTGQCVRPIGSPNSGLGFGLVGTVGLLENINGVATSSNGLFWTTSDAQLFTDARYGVFLSANEWYVSAGDWPSSNDDNGGATNDNTLNNDNNSLRGSKSSRRPAVIQKTPRFSVRRDEVTGKYRPHVRLGAGNNTNFEAQISMTNDGGKTWTSVFEDHQNFYANGIDCAGSGQCCFVAEADAGPAPGSRILCTWNGGAQWNVTLFNSGAENSLLDIRSPGPNEYWAVGGTISSLSSTAQFFHSTDGGHTWKLDSTIDGSYATAVDCVDSSHCWATMVEVLLQTSSIAALQA